MCEYLFELSVIVPFGGKLKIFTNEVVSLIAYLKTL